MYFKALFYINNLDEALYILEIIPFNDKHNSIVEGYFFKIKNMIVNLDLSQKLKQEGDDEFSRRNYNKCLLIYMNALKISDTNCYKYITSIYYSLANAELLLNNYQDSLSNISKS